MERNNTPQCSGLKLYSLRATNMSLFGISLGFQYQAIDTDLAYTCKVKEMLVMTLVALEDWHLRPLS